MDSSSSNPSSDDSPQAIARDVAAVGRLAAVPALLRVVCEFTGMGFAAVARVSDDSWTACAVQDHIAFGLKPGDQLAIETTLCREARATRQPVVIDQASADPVYRGHHTPRIYGIESYISVPIVRTGGAYFGNLCAIDPQPARLADGRTLAMFQLFAELIALQLDNDDRTRAAEAALLTAQQTAELREHFIAVLGHDLRNPVAAVGVAAELLVRKTAQPDVVKIGERLRATTRRMAGLIDDVMDFARGRLGAGIAVALADTDGLAVALREAVDELRLTHPGRAVVDAITIDRPVRCDTGRLQQLVSNLVGNALTYGAADEPVRIEAALHGSRLVLGVANGGAPIATENLGRVFEPYWRPADGRPGGGLGLGLYICAQIVKAHGGSLTVSSTAESGTRFVATLPIGAGEDPVHGPFNKSSS